MTSRDIILQQVTANKPAFFACPVIDTGMVIKYDALFLQYKTVLESIGGTITELTEWDSCKAEIYRQKAEGKKIINTIPELGEINFRLKDLTASQLMETDIAYLHGVIAVAENGAIWLNETRMVNRLLPFICQQLVLVIQKEDIVATMHQAYHQIDTFKEGFGVFIAGPSKTADIEQSLVIGAHGPLSLKVMVYSNRMKTGNSPE
jgi:L-lactate dehydrogenase complex protein LldG